MSQSSNNNTRRGFLQTTLIGISGIGIIRVAQAQSSQHLFLEASEIDFLEAAVDRLIPPDEKWAGGKDAGVVTYIDRQMSGPWGKGDQLYMSGPYIPGPPSLGYQLGFTPAQMFRRAITAINQRFKNQGTSFKQLSHQEQDAFLSALEAGKFDLNGVPSSTFFGFLWEHTLEGFFADPVYGGNRDKVGWRMIGFPGAYSDFYEWIDKHGVPFTREPLSIADEKASPPMQHEQHGGK
jgi:gluconate 2-dehydrogenase gamma chain